MPTVAVWKRDWLPASETFVRNHLHGLLRWHSSALGLKTINSPLSDESDTILGSVGMRLELEQRLLIFLGWNQRISQHLTANRPDLAHIHFVDQARGIHRIFKRLDIPYVITVHGNDVTRAPRARGLRGHLYRREARLAFRGAARVIAISSFTARRAQELGAAENKIRVLPLGIPVPDRRKVLKAYDVGFLGRLEAHKGVDHLLRAVAGLSSDSNAITIGIAGDGSQRATLENLAADLRLNVDFLGPLASQDVPSFLASCSVVAIPSVPTDDGVEEGLGLVGLEAGAQHRPVVGYATGGIPEAIVHGVTGFLSRPGDERQLGNHLRDLLSDPELRNTMGDAAREHVARSFDLRRQTQLLEEIYDQVMSER